MDRKAIITTVVVLVAGLWAILLAVRAFGDDSVQVVDFYSAAWCRYCPDAENKLTAAAVAGKLPFKIRKRAFEELPAGSPQQIPQFQWDSKSGRLYTLWSGVDDLVGKVRRSTPVRK